MKKALSISETARALSVSRGTLYGLIAKGELATVRIGRRHLVQVTSIDTFIADHTPTIASK